MMTINDTYRLKDFGLEALIEYVDPVTPSFVEKVVKIPGNPGSHLLGEEVENRYFSIPCQLVSRGHIDLQNKLEALDDLFRDEEGKRVSAKISLDHWQGKYVYAYLNSTIESDRLVYKSEVNLDFVCYDPYKYAPVYAEDVYWGSDEINFESQYILGHEGSDGLVSVTGNTSLEVYVDGLVVYPTIEIQGTATGLTLTNDGQTIKFPDFANSEWVVERFISWQNDQEKFVSAHKFKLHKGKNIIQVSGTDFDFKIRIKYRDRYK